MGKVVAGVFSVAEVIFNASVSACEKGRQWRPTLAIAQQMYDQGLETDVIPGR